MMTYEVIVVETAEDARRAAADGLYNFDLRGCECDNCAMAVGPVVDDFLPVCIVADIVHEEAWLVCIDCSQAVLTPGFWRQHGEN